MKPQTIVKITSEALVPIWFATATNADVVVDNLRVILNTEGCTSSNCLAMLLATSPTWPLSVLTNGLTVVHLHFRERKLYRDDLQVTI